MILSTQTNEFSYFLIIQYTNPIKPELLLSVACLFVEYIKQSINLLSKPYNSNVVFKA